VICIDACVQYCNGLSCWRSGSAAEGRQCALQVINNCVGQGNARLFLAYCLALLPAQLLFLHLVAAFCRLAAQAPDAGFFAALWQASAWHPGIVLLAAVQVPLTSISAAPRDWHCSLQRSF
jgi:hypothetical protein